MTRQGDKFLTSIAFVSFLRRDSRWTRGRGTSAARCCRGLAAAAALACASCAGSTSPSSVNIVDISGSPNPALQTATTVAYGFTGDVSGHVGDSSTRLWDFGDGMTGTESGGEAPAFVTHIYNTPGVFTIRLTITTSDGVRASKEGTLTVKTLTGRWMLDTGQGFYDFVHSGSAFTGVFSGGTLSGTVQSTDPRVTFTHTRTVGGASATTTFRLQNGNTSGDVLQGTLDGGGFVNTSVRLTRQ